MRKTVRNTLVGAAAAIALAVPVALPASLSDLPTASAATQAAVKEGQRGDSVTAVQLLLNSKGAKLEVDGSFGPATKKAVTEFQSDNGLEADGIVGPKTIAKLAPVVKSGDEGNAVKAAQTVIGVEADGIFGPNTKSAVISYQKENGLEADGVVGPNTWGSLLNGSGDGGGDDGNTGDADRSNPVWRQQVVMESLVDKGFTPEQAAGIVGNMITESGVEPTQHELGYPFPSTRGWGLVQWTHSRNTEIVAKVENELGSKYYTNDPSSLTESEWKKLLDFQIDYVIHELDTTHKVAGDGIRNSSTAEEAAIIFLEKFEIPQDIPGQRPIRAEQANEVLRVYNAGGVDAI